jgi:hypothetical protein
VHLPVVSRKFQSLQMALSPSSESPILHVNLEHSQLTFELHVRQDYNERRFWDTSQLNFHRVSKSLTYHPKETSRPLVASSPAMESSCDTVGKRIEHSPCVSMLERPNILIFSGVFCILIAKLAFQVTLWKYRFINQEKFLWQPKLKPVHVTIDHPQ